MFDWKNVYGKGDVAELELPKVSVIIPTYQSAEKIGTTLESLVAQDYPDFEVIVIDAGSQDRTLEIVKGMRNTRIQVYTVTGYQRYEMLNKGISLATGTYIGFLFPGDYYLSLFTLRWIMNLAVQQQRPPMVYCGTLLRDGKSEVKVLYRPLDIKLLRHGQQPSSLQSCWFHQAVFAQIGKFDTRYAMRGGFELLCRFVNSGLTAHSLYRVLTDYDLRASSRHMLLQHFVETGHIVRRYFGWWAYLSWLFRQHDTRRIFNSWARSIKIAFIGN